MFLTNNSSLEAASLPSVAVSARPAGARGSGRRWAAPQWSGLCGTVLAVADCVTIILAYKLAFFLARMIGAPVMPHIGAPVVGAPVVGAMGWQSDGLLMLGVAIAAYLGCMGRYSDRIPFWHDARLVVSTSLCALACEVGLGIIDNDLVARLPILFMLLLFPVLATGANLLAKTLLARAGAWTLPVVVIGSHEAIAETETALQSDRSLGYRVVGRLDPAAVMAGSFAPRLHPVLEAYQAKSLVIATDGSDPLHRQLIQCALQERVRFAAMMQPYPAPTFASRPTCFFSHDAMLLSFQNDLSRPLPLLAKATMDILIAAVLLVLTAPVFLTVAVLNLLDGGPVLFRQLRVGVGGRPFHCLKFRTMVVDADRVLDAALASSPALAVEWEARRKLQADPRVTRVGRLLRKTSLDELPQLINVLRRDMSLVGPRPIVPAEISLYGESIAQYYATRPGLTGLWQVSGRSNTSYARRVQLDVWYVNNWTFWHDIAVLLKTIPAVFNREGAF